MQKADSKQAETQKRQRGPVSHDATEVVPQLPTVTEKLVGDLGNQEIKHSVRPIFCAQG